MSVITNIDNQQTGQGKVTLSRNLSVSGRPVNTDASASSSQTNKLDAVRVDENTARMSGLLSRSTQASDFAQSIYEAGKAVEQVQDLVQRMVGDLETFTKMYPPYPPGSEERIQMMKNYAAFKSLIDRLTIPPVADASSENRGSVASTGDASVGQPATNV